MGIIRSLRRILGRGTSTGGQLGIALQQSRKIAEPGDRRSSPGGALVLAALQALAFAGCAQPGTLMEGDDGLNSVGGAGSASGTGSTANAGGSGPGWMQTGTPLPCAVSSALRESCQACHGTMPIGGAPMPLVTYDDFARDYTAATSQSVLGQTMKVHELAHMRINDPSAPMPPGRNITQANFDVINNWLESGAPPGGEADRTCEQPGTGGSGSGGSGVPSGGSGVGGSGTPSGGSGVGGSGTGGSGVGGSSGGGSLCDAAGAYEPLVARPGETCYEFAIHNGQMKGDTTPYSIRTGEHYEQFYYTAPWPTGSIATRFGARFENLSVLHHWLLFSSAKSPTVEGTHETVIGTQLGDAAQLLAGWAVGGCAMEMPADVGLELPAQGTVLNVQWHFYNSTGAPIPDGTAVQVCTVPAGSRPNVGSITWLGTENFNSVLGMPPGPSEFGGTCVNDSMGPITIWSFWPHMHALGRNMRSVVQRVDGTTEEVFNKPFDFNYQVHYEQSPKVILQPGDKITSTCAFQNDTGVGVPFGPSSTQEMCYQFTFSYPARALDNGVLSLIGASNTCW